MQAVSYGWCAAAISSSLFCYETPEMPEGAYSELFRPGGIETHGNASSEKPDLTLGGRSCEGASPKRLSQKQKTGSEIMWVLYGALREPPEMRA
jgi:hypothetical protein